MTVDRDAWTCPDCHQTTRGALPIRFTAQLRHGGLHRTDRRIAERRRHIEAEEKAEALADRKRARLMAKGDRERLRRIGRGQHPTPQPPTTRRTTR